MAGTTSTDRPVEYLPPDRDSIYQYARQVCNRIAEQTDPACADPDVIHGLAEFMQLAARIQVKHLNHGGSVDSPHD